MNRFVILIMIFFFFGCSKNREVIAEGYLLDELTKHNFNPYNGAFVILYDVSNANSVEIGRVYVDNDGHYIIKTTYKSSDSKGNLVLKGDPEYPYSNSVTLSSHINSNFEIYCWLSLERVFKNQSGNPYDSIVTVVNNSKGQIKNNVIFNVSNYMHYFIAGLRGQEKNYINTKLYYNATVIQRYDTINSPCRVILKDTITY